MTLILPTKDNLQAASNLLKEKQFVSPLIDSAGIFLKLDAQLPGGSYKIRGVEFFIHNRKENVARTQVLSAGNLALALALKCSCEAIVPEGISEIKRSRLIKEGATVIEKSFNEIWKLVEASELRQSQTFLHPFNKELLAGYGSIIPELDWVGESILVVPYGLGGLATALCHAIDVLNSKIKIVLCEITNHDPFTRAKEFGQPHPGNKLKSFIEAMGAPTVVNDIFHYLHDRIFDVVTVSEAEVAQEIIKANQKGLRLEGAAGAALVAAKKLTSTLPIIALMTGANISDDFFINHNYHYMDHTG